MSEEGRIEPALSPDQAKKVLRKNVQNLVEKVKSGKLLNAQELATVEAMAEGRDAADAKGWAKNKVELAELIGADRSSLDNWLADGAPKAHSNGLYNVNDWRDWMREKGKRPRKTAAAQESQSKGQLEARRLLLMNEKLEHEIAVIKGEWTKNTDIERQVIGVVTEVRKVLLAIPDALAPQVVGLTVPEAAKRLRDAVDDALLRMHTLLGRGGTPDSEPVPASKEDFARTEEEEDETTP